MLDRNVNGSFSMNISVQFPLLSQELSYTIPYSAVICGFEKFTIRNGASLIEFELDGQDLSETYFEETKVEDIFSMMGVSKKCPITSYNLFKSKYKDPQDKYSGLKFLHFD